MAVGARNCAEFKRADSVDRSFDIRGRWVWTWASSGAIKGGRLKEANIEIESRVAKRRREISGTAVAVAVAAAATGVVLLTTLERLPPAPNQRANRPSLYTHSVMLTALVAKNLGTPDDTVWGGWLERAEERVSTLLAVV